jgi:hypothetical protein
MIWHYIAILLMVLLFLFCLCYTAVKLEYSLNIFLWGGITRKMGQKNSAAKCNVSVSPKQL